MNHAFILFIFGCLAIPSPVTENEVPVVNIKQQFVVTYDCHERYKRYNKKEFADRTVKMLTDLHFKIRYKQFKKNKR